MRVVQITKLHDLHYMITASVRHSQKLSVAPAKPWVAVKQNGIVVCTHCTCMAGLGEACSHVAALLFTLEGNTKMKKNVTCTSLPCSWLPPSFQSVPYAELSDVEFATPQEKRRKVNDTNTSTWDSEQSRVIKPPSQEELNFFYKSLSETGKPVILSLIPRFSDSFIPLSVKGIIPKPLTDLYKDEHLDISYPELLNKCERVYNSYSITSEMAKNVAKKTQGQALSKICFQQQSGRVTASRLKAAVSTDITQPSVSLIKNLSVILRVIGSNQKQHLGAVNMNNQQF